jgi:uncharacterized protein
MLTRRELLAGMATVPFFTLTKGELQTMDQRISAVTLGVKDLAFSKKFYVNGLGWKPVFENSEIIFFQTGGMIFALFLRDQLAGDFGADPKSYGRAPMSLGYNVRTRSEVDSLIQSAQSAGGTLLSRASEKSWGGYSGYFADPDGFAWEVAWNPAWPMAPDGSVKFGI